MILTPFNFDRAKAGDRVCKGEPGDVCFVADFKPAEWVMQYKDYVIVVLEDEGLPTFYHRSNLSMVEKESVDPMRAFDFDLAKARHPVVLVYGGRVNPFTPAEFIAEHKGFVWVWFPNHAYPCTHETCYLRMV